MNCKKAQRWLQGYVDGELSTEQMKRVRAHVDRCPECGGALARLSELKTLLAERRPRNETGAAPEFFWAQIKARIQGEADAARGWRVALDVSWPRVFAWAGAGAAVLALGAFVWLQTLPNPSQIAAIPPPAPAEAQVDKIETSGPGLYAEAYHSKESKATIIWTEGMPVISLEL